MNKIKILDCTLRDGGYINEWFFGKKAIKGIANNISLTGVDYIEVGFIRDEKYFEDQAQFSEISQIYNMFYPKKSSVKIAGMVETGYLYPLDRIPERSTQTLDMFRVVMWKRMLKEGLEYSEQLQKKGYEVCIQASRIEQYSYSEFEELIKLFNKINPLAVYIVDTFGLLEKYDLLKYAKIADQYLNSNISIGYHAHNNLQQAMTNATSLAEEKWNHSLMIDVSVMGIGRGAGNLNSELFLRYLIEHNQGDYNIDYIIDVAENFILPIYQKNPWGYSLPYYFSAIYGCNPNYASYFMTKDITCRQMEKTFRSLKENGEGIIFTEALADKALSEYLYAENSSCI